MAINNKPIFTGTPAIGVTKFTQTTLATFQQIFPTTPSTWVEGLYAQKIRIKLGSGTGNTNSHVFSLYVYNGTSPDTTYASLYDTLLIPATTGTNTSTSPIYEMPLNIALPTGWYLYANFTGTAAGTFTFDVITTGGTYTAQ